MVRREKCPQCDKDVEVDKELITKDTSKIAKVFVSESICL